MKKFFYLMVLALVPLCFTSCGSDDDDSGSVNVSPQQLYGKWVNTKYVWIDEDGREEDPVSSNRYIVFESNGTGTVNPYNLFENEIRGTFNWTVNDGVLIISEQGNDVQRYTISKLAGEELELTWKDEGNTEITTFVKQK